MLASFRALAFTLLSFLFLSVVGLPSPATDAAAGDPLGGLTIGEIINALGVGLVEHINANISLDSLTTNLIDIDFTVKNPLIIELTIDTVFSTAGLNDTVFATFNHTFAPPGLVVPILGTADSGTINNVLLVQGAINSLNIIPFGELDLFSVNVSVRAGSIFGFGGIPIPIDGLKQSDVPVTYTLDVD